MTAPLDATPAGQASTRITPLQSTTPQLTTPQSTTPQVTTPQVTTPRFTTMPSPVGDLLLLADDAGLTHVLMLPWDSAPDTSAMTRDDDGPVLGAARAQLQAYFAGELTEFDVPLSLHGTPFRRRVWEALCEIPYGETWSYGKLAAHLGDPKLTRAVGTANGQNPVSIIVPCHRVIGANGSLVGYAGGLDRKRTLLALEARVTTERNFGDA